KGDARVRLIEDSDATLLRYEVKANVGGKLAQLGSRLIDATAKKLADEFFATFSEKAAQAAAAELAEPAAPPPAEPAAAPPPPPEPEPKPAEAPPKPPPAAAPTPAPSTKGLPTWLWVAGLIVVVAIVLAIFGRG